MDSIGISVIGLGGRARHIVNLLRAHAGPRVRILGGFDPDAEQAAASFSAWGVPALANSPSAAAAARLPGVDWVMVFSTNVHHREGILAGFDAGRHVFAEKPLATTVDDCVAIRDAHRARPELHFATGFVLRYAPMYRKVKEILDSGVVGDVVSIDANENITPRHGTAIMTHWRRFTSESGPHILEKCCHDLDLLNWFCGALPSRVASFGGLDYFVPRRQPLFEKYGQDVYGRWRDHPDEIAVSPFTIDKDLMDNQVGIVEYANGARVQFQATMANAMPERRMFLSCTEGTLSVELYSGEMRFARLGREGVTLYDFGALEHGGGDARIMAELFDDTMVGNRPPPCGGDEGLRSAVLALALDEAARTGQVIDLRPVWRRLDDGAPAPKPAARRIREAVHG